MEDNRKIEHHKFTSFSDDWTIKFANVDEDTAFEKLVALRTLNDNENKIYYIVNMEYLWSKEPLVLTDEVNPVQETEQQELF